MESGEGIERLKCFSVNPLESCDVWNPEKELKGVVVKDVSVLSVHNVESGEGIERITELAFFLIASIA